jgi:hypothetical protein
MSTTPTTSIANMQNLMIQLGTAVPNTIIVGSSTEGFAKAAPKMQRSKAKKTTRR